MWLRRLKPGCDVAVIRLAVVIEALGRGGAERLLVDTARLLNRSRFQMRVYTLFPVRRDYESTLRALAIPERCLGLRSHRHLVNGISRLRALFQEQRPDIVHTHLFGASIVGRLAARMVGCPVVSTIHDADYEPIVRRGNPGLTRAKQLSLQAADAATVLASRARIVAVSEYVAQSVRRRLGVRGSRVETIHNGVDVDLYRPDGARRHQLRVTLSLRPDTRVLICVGRMTPQKGQETLIRAMSELRVRAPDAPLHLLLVGDGAWRPAYESLARELGVETAISFLGPRWDVVDLLRAADILVLPSIHEGFGLVLAEALASGVPVVASRIGPVPEIVRPGETGLLFEPMDSHGLTQAIATLLADPVRLEQMGRLGRDDALARFGLPQMVRHLESFYERVLEETASTRRQPEPAETA